MKFNIDWFSLKGKVAIVTGGNTGLGLGYVDALSKVGADVFVTHYDKNIEEVTKVVQKNGQKVCFWEGDLTKKGSSEKVLKAAIKSFGHVDILVNNAGTISREPILEHSKEKWDRVIDINLNVVWSLSQVVAKHMVQRKTGKIINIASMLSFQGGKFVPGYTASKHGVVGLTKAFANELAQKGIQINAIAPGYIISANTQPIRKDKKRNEEIISRIPVAKWGTPEDLKGIVVFLSSFASNYINGATICVDGGWQAR